MADKKLPSAFIIHRKDRYCCCYFHCWPNQWFKPWTPPLESTDACTLVLCIHSYTHSYTDNCTNTCLSADCLNPKNTWNLKGKCFTRPISTKAQDTEDNKLRYVLNLFLFYCNKSITQKLLFCLTQIFKKLCHLSWPGWESHITSLPEVQQ